MDGVMNNVLTKDKFSLIRKLIEKNGFKFTKQRKLILEQFFLADRHLSVEEIYQRLKENNIGLATVYRNVKIFNGIGIVKGIVVDGVSYYELKIYSKKPLHIHFQCVKCNDIIDIDERKVALEYLKLNKAIEDINDLEIYDVNIMLVGLCKRCREENECQDR
ncbi:Fur family transcriptional regulator [Acetivibrio straminisolvens]|jgi:Fe2+ or Zn2+ uptake regulation protein|uniref:Ferric uptake regulation protein FUR n=1 Tax=Acetivibrio straminisolvens JCM 21531 TaxID=1294263 RepID=W4VB53_9FIRM|nr:Fur family transcriptional regulator [Acetivibrio straminisolvens]GAE90665.1 ferric uptake regulation protein FUR [Acetivibrio straminisolvens JCM 21531]